MFPATWETATFELRQSKAMADVTRLSLRGVVLTNLAKQLPRRPPAKAREARFVDEGGVLVIFLAKLVSTTPRNERPATEVT